MEKIIQLDSIDAYNKLYGLPTLHPLVTVVDLTKATSTVNHVKMNYGVYALFLKQAANCTLKYGRQYYDYQEGTIVCFAPGQLIGVDAEKDEIKKEVYGLIFHPDLIHGTALGQNISKYTYFSYEQNEALHLSEQEKTIVMDCLHKIQLEMEYPVDRHSKELLSVNIELLLDYCLRFYDRQFHTREKVNSDILRKFEQHLNEYFRNGESQKNGLPSVRFFAEKAYLSPGYFGDLIKKETGKTAQEYIQSKIIDLSKQYLLGTQQSIGEIAYSLGFQYPQHFSRLFKRYVGCTPNEFRTME
ncbi:MULTISPECIES: AraC family transcriptional regulator [unclassified Bacteroides]|jgi:AraC-like DNA-binding protein|uniref:helix-turn-helix domain-containing protein n=1 Tax=unclassified Bacteroides TaxID=2646097 RepID=UPI000E913158|nr:MULTISPECIES: AraC family transcriptional regulator [unclassified Bacteroides]RGN50889.1 AraC family transcriptional regulator [Bacteroides sp. OM05-12]RHR82176.1 AraC family transcriptional regulator [Bacteroides sp. AF16-49]